MIQCILIKKLILCIIITYYIVPYISINSWLTKIIYNKFLKMDSLLKIPVVFLALMSKISGGCVGNICKNCGTN